MIQMAVDLMVSGVCDEVAELVAELPWKALGRTDGLPFAQGHRLPWGDDASSPLDVALLLQWLEPQRGEVILDVGSGSGALALGLARAGAVVFSIDRHKGCTLPGVHWAVGDGLSGLPEKAPFNAIIAGGALARVPEAWYLQLQPEGRILLPLGCSVIQKLTLICKGEHSELQSVSFLPLVG